MLLVLKKKISHFSTLIYGNVSCMISISKKTQNILNSSMNKIRKGIKGHMPTEQKLNTNNRITLASTKS